jgi:hypothetical protein
MISIHPLQQTAHATHGLLCFDSFLRVRLLLSFTVRPQEDARVDDVLLELLYRLEAVGDAHGELFDSDFREAMDAAVFYGFIKPKAGYALPETFALFTPEGDRKVREVLAWFLPAARQAAERTGLDTFHKRLWAFQNLEVRTARKNDYNDFFGWSNPELFDEAGNVIRRG